MATELTFGNAILEQVYSRAILDMMNKGAEHHDSLFKPKPRRKPVIIIYER